MYINNIEVKIVPSYPEYAASMCGKIFRIQRQAEMAQRCITVHGYPSMYTRISMFNEAKDVKVHRLICEAWHGDPPSELHTDVNHKDGNSLNNHYSNLEWATKSQNQRHAYDTGLRGRGSQLYNGSLSDDQVHEICKLLIDGARADELSDRYGVSVDIIRKIKAGDTYFHVRGLYEIPHTYRCDFSEATIKWVCQRILDGYSDKGIVEISTNKNLTPIEIKRIRHKIRYKYISDLYF